jgi:hypothetical protein
MMLLVGNAHGLTFEESGIPYETLETENFKVRYEPGDRQAAQDVSKALEDSYEKITRDLGLKPNGKTIIELYTTPSLYQRYRKPAPWAIGGKVYPERNMIALSSPSTWGEANIHRYEDLWHVMPHEYTHVILRRYRLPMWLDEGIAVYESGQWNPGYQRILREAIEEDELLSLRELEDFNAFIAHGAMSYAESYTAVAYIKIAYGDEAFRKLLEGVATGMSFEKALRATTGKGGDEFEEGWQRYLEEMLKPERQVEIQLKTLKEARAETPITYPSRDKARIQVTPAKVAVADYVSKDEITPPWLLMASFAMLLLVTLLIRALKALSGKATEPIL